MTEASSTPLRGNLKTVFSLWKHIKSFQFTLLWRDLKTQQSAVSLDLSLLKTQSGKSRDYRTRHLFPKTPIRSRDAGIGVSGRPSCICKFLQLSVDRAWIIDGKKMSATLELIDLTDGLANCEKKVLLPSSYFWRMYSFTYIVWPEKITQYVFFFFCKIRFPFQSLKFSRMILISNFSHFILITIQTNQIAR